MSIIDDYSRKLWVYILKSTTEAFERFKEWCSEVENEKGVYLKCLRTDNGWSFYQTNSATFVRVRVSKGIKQYLRILNKME